jgi:hypothetical protein
LTDSLETRLKTHNTINTQLAILATNRAGYFTIAVELDKIFISLNHSGIGVKKEGNVTQVPLYVGVRETQ